MEIEEFEHKILPYKNQMYRLALNLLKDKDDALDAVQEAFLRLWTKLKKLDGSGNIQALVMITVKNICIDNLRLKKRQFLKLDDDDMIADDISITKNLEITDAREKINEIIQSLPDRQRVMIHLRDVENMSNEQVASILKMNINAVRTGISRIRKKIREILVKDYGYVYHEN